ncbi:MAG: ECF transporter S component [Candidatus Korarchaeota archaeon]|nr:ECF transporter S component [Candidatus Korarchaeota archaeon]
MGSRSFSVTGIVAMGVGTALYAAFNVFFNMIQLPGTQLVALRPSVSIPMFFGYIFGPIVGFVAGFLGNIISDAISWGGFWWNWDVGNGILGLIPGLAIYFLSGEKLFERKGLLMASILSIVASILGMGFAAYTDYIFGYGISTIEEATYALFLPAAITDAINGAILTPILVAAYSSAVKGRARRS